MSGTTPAASGLQWLVVIPLLSVVIPTIGRETLFDLLDSIGHPQGVEVLVVADTHGADGERQGALKYARKRFSDNYGYPYRWLDFDGGLNCWGHPQRRFGDGQAMGQWLIHSQDDNIFSPTAFDDIRNAIDSQKRQWRRPILFRAMTWQAGLVWRIPELTEGNIDADCIVTPNIVDRLGRWEFRYAGDWDFIRQTCALWDNTVEWREEIISCALPGLHDPASAA